MSYNIVTSNEHTLKSRIWAFVLKRGRESCRENINKKKIMENYGEREILRKRK